MTRREHDLATKLNNGGPDPLWSVSQYRRQERKHVAAWITDPLAKRRVGRIAYYAALRAIGAGRGNSQLRGVVAAWENAS
jgi:hypothetical protein